MLFLVRRMIGCTSGRFASLEVWMEEVNSWWSDPCGKHEISFKMPFLPPRVSSVSTGPIDIDVLLLSRHRWTSDFSERFRCPHERLLWATHLSTIGRRPAGRLSLEVSKWLLCEDTRRVAIELFVPMIAIGGDIHGQDLLRGALD